MSGYQALILVGIGLAIPLAVGAWRGRRLALICGLAWGVTGFIFKKGDVVTAAVLFLVPPLIGIVSARRLFKE